MSSPLPLRVGLLGYGWVNREVWEPRLAQHPAARVVARYAPAGVAGALDRLSSIEDFWATPMDIVIVGTPSHTPCHLAREAARRGCSDLLEKPSCLAIAEYDSGIEQMSSDAVLMTAMSAVFRADVRLLVDSIGPGPFDIGASW